jgi:hypothetical protein
VILSGSVPRPAVAAVIAAASCTRANVGAAVATAADGDTVLIPVGTCSWTTQLDITKGISLIGGGIDQTILQDNVPKDGSPSSRLISVNVTAPRTFRLSAFTIQGAAPDLNTWNKGHVLLDGTAKAFRVDHVKITNQQTSAMVIDGDLWGVIDHSVFSGAFQFGIKVMHTNWGGKDFGDGSWAEQLYWGTQKAIYIEDCDFTELSPNFSSSALDGLDGARVVFRYNTLHNQNGTSHGADSGQRERGFRSLEIYNNTYIFNRAVAFIQWIRGGTGVVYNNTVTGGGQPNNLVQLVNCRDSGAGCNDGFSFPPWGACDGSGAYDQNMAGQSGYMCVDQPGSGTSRLVAGDPPTPVGWIGNISDPVYIWNNTVNGAANNSVAATQHVQSGRDYFTGTPKSGYTAYTYPHPLTTSTGTPPSSPINLRIIKS